MLFNSGIFLLFFAAFLLLYWLVRENLDARNLLIVAASYVFYGWWDWRFLGLLAFSSLLDYGVGRMLGTTAEARRRKALLASSVFCNLAVLGFFKYYGFFAGSLSRLLADLHVPVQPATLGIILPVGISFYTFQSMSYSIDVYRGAVAPERNVIRFLAFVSFFPQLVAGPIERAAHLLPQLAGTRRISRAMVEEGLWLLLWGMFKKVVLADNLAPLVQIVYDGSVFAAPSVALATLTFGLQIYCDFSGYSDIARGTARLLGFDIMFNFNLPYTATSLREFWRRWHISLSTWLRDYLYIGLGGNRHGAAHTYRNLFLTMFLGGLWHGAAWNFVLWGAWHGGGLMAERAAGRRSRPGRRGLGSAAAWSGTMLFVFYGWLLFRAPSIGQAMAMTRALADFSCPPWIGSYLVNLALFTAPLAAMQIWQHRRGDLLPVLALRGWARAAIEGLILFAIVIFWERAGMPFVYFQF